MARPWDFEQSFTADSDGEAAPTGGGFGMVVNNRERHTADAVERNEVREMVADARERHHGNHSDRGDHERPLIHLNDVPWDVH